MKKQNIKSSEAAILRQKAEELLKKKLPKTGSKNTEFEALKLIHELEVHQIELELQTDELMLAKEKAAELATEKYAELYDFAPAGYFTLSTEGKIIELNLSGSQMLGKERSHLKNSQFGFFVSDDTKHIFNLFLGMAFSGKAKESCEVILSTNGNLPMYIYLTGIVTENGEQCLVTMVDITERKLAEQMLIIANKELVFQNQEKEKRAAALIIANKELVFQNEEKEKRAVALIIANKELAIQNEEKEKRAAALIIANKELAIQNEEKEKRATALIIANKELVFQNEEKEKRAAELIIANEHAKESDNLKTAFLNNISHEIRTPFNGILGFLSIIQDNDLTDSERDEYIKIINKSAFRLMNTINDIVEISQIQAGQTKLSVSETNIHSLTNGVYNHFKTDAENKGLKFSINNYLPINLDFINTDSTKLNTILTILIGNAIKFTKAGSIEFGIKLKAVGEPAELVVIEPVELEFSVKDTGIGIPKDKQQAIFERFMQADGSNTRLFEGSGIGLSIVKAYVEMLGGKIWVESEEGKGTEFFLTIPCNYEPQDKNVIRNVELADLNEDQIKPLKILIAEDDEISGELIEIAVKIFGTEVLKVRTGVEAIEVCRNDPDIDFVLMDIKMPEMDGYEATRQIRKFNTDVIIIAQTSHALSGDKEKAIAAGCNDYISKPFSQASLTSLMKKHLKK